MDYKAVPPGAPRKWDAIIRDRALAVCGFSDSFEEWKSGHGETLYTATSADTSTVADALLTGGGTLLSTGANANNAAEVNNQGARTLVSDISTKPWYVHSRCRITTTAGANTLMTLAGLTDAGGTHYVRAIARPASSATLICLDIDGTITTSTLTLATVVAGLTDVAISSDATTITLWSNGVAVKTGLVSTIGGAAGGYYWSKLTNGAAGANQAFQLQNSYVATNG